MRTWTLTSFTDRSSLPTSVRIKYGDDNVYFAELTQSQLEAGGKGLGTFIQNGSITNGDETVAPATGGLSEGSMLKCVDRAYWGTGNSRSDLYLAEYRVGESGCIAKSSRNLKNICKLHFWPGSERY